MENRNSSGLAGPAVIITLLAALGLGPALRSSPAPNGTASKSMSTGSDSEVNEIYEHSAANLLEKFFSTYADKLENKLKPWATHQELDPKSTFSSDDERSRYSIRFLIATLPLPTSPPLRYLFDSEIYALQSAAGTAQYSLDSFDLPWIDEAKDTSGKIQLGGEIDVSGSGIAGKKATQVWKPNSDDENRWKRDSGVMLFRNDTSPKPQLLVVFIVAETPNRGINQVALRDALDQIAWLKGWGVKAGGSSPPAYLRRGAEQSGEQDDMLADPRNEVRIVGPAFSGSASSLRNTLEDWRRLPGLRSRDGKLTIRVMSGTATAVSKEQISIQDGEFPPIIFNSVQIPDQVLWDQIIPDIRNEIAEMSQNRLPSFPPVSIDSPADVALLRENTSFGMAGPLYPIEARGVFQMLFPLHISELRSARKKDQGKAANLPDLGRHNLSLPDEASQQRRDVIPPVSPRAAIYDELVLNDVLTTIRRKRIRYVGVVATDVEDLVYLAQQVRSNCPDTILFTTSADLRFLHSEVNDDLRGMLIFNTYPLFGKLQDWTESFKFENPTFSRISENETFSSDFAYGVYNATLALLGRPESVLEYGPPFVEWPHYPELQVGVVGRDDIWPLAFQDTAYETAGSSNILFENNQGLPLRLPSSRADLGERLYPPSFLVFFFILNIGILTWTIALLPEKPPFFWWKEHWWFQDRWWFQAFANRPDSPFRVARDLCETSLLTGMLIAEIIGLGFVLLPPHVALPLTQSVLPMSATFGVTLIFELLIGLLVLTAWIWSLARIFRYQEGLWLRLGFAAASSVPIGLALWYIVGIWTRPPAFALFAFLRATHLHNGVSALMPFVFLGIAGFALVAGHFWRIVMLEDRSLPSPILPNTPSLQGMAGLESQLVETLYGSPLQKPAGWFLLILLAFGFIYFGLTKLGAAFSFEGWRFDILFTFLGFAVYSTFSLILLRLTFTWLAMRQLLRRLYFHPSRYCYKNLQLAARPSHLERQKVLLFESRSDVTAIEYGLGCVRSILRIAHQADQAAYQMAPNFKQVKQAHSQLVSDIENKRYDLLETVTKAEMQLHDILGETSWLQTIKSRAAFHETLTKLSNTVVSLFEPVWRLRERTPPLEAILTGEDDKLTIDRQLLQQGELFIASRVVDLVRHVFPHLVNLAGFAVPAVVAMMLAVSAFPFPAHDTLLWVGWTVLFATIFVTLSVFISINRNPILSMISGTDPGQFNWDSAFTMHLLIFAVIPVLTLLGAQYPGALSGTVSWLGSLLGGGGNG